MQENFTARSAVAHSVRRMEHRAKGIEFNYFEIYNTQYQIPDAACCKLSAASCISPCPMPYALCLLYNGQYLLVMCMFLRLNEKLLLD